MHAVGADLSGLLAGTLYHYRLVAHVGASTADGSDATFTTVPLATVVTTGAATGVTLGGAI